MSKLFTSDMYTELLAKNKKLEQENAKLKERLKDADDKLDVIANTSTDIDSFALEQSFRKKAREYKNKWSEK